MKKFLIMSVAAAVIAACSGESQIGTGNGEGATPTYEGYQESGPINNYAITDIQTRQLELINAVRADNGAAPVQLSQSLTDAAITQARDIASQQRAWNYGSDKSTPQTRAQRAGFTGVVTGENVSESYRGEVDVMQSWLRDSMSRSVIVDPQANQVGIAYYQDRTGKVWWVQDFGALGATQAP